MKLSALLGCCFKSPVTELDVEKAKQRMARLRAQQEVRDLAEVTAPGVNIQLDDDAVKGIVASREKARKNFFAGYDQPTVDLRKVSEPFNPAPYSA